MGTYNPNVFEILRATDRQLVDALLSVKGPLSLNSITLSFGSSGFDAVTFAPNEYTTKPQVSKILAHDSYLVNQLAFAFSDRGNVTVSRTGTSPGIDSVNVSISDEKDAARFMSFLASIRQALSPFEARMAFDKYIGAELAQFYQLREASLQKLEDMSGRIIRNAEDYRARTDAIFAEKEAALLKKLENRTAELENAFKLKEQQLTEERAALEKRLKEVDDRASKHARREASQQMRQKLLERGTSFKLTEGTRQLRLRTGALALGLLVAFGVLEFVALKQFPATAPTSLGEWVYFIIHFVVPGLCFGATAIYLLRWTNDWAERHAREEFRHKRLELDVDRAAFVVETAFQWHEEEKAVIPDTLVERLSANLFSDDFSSPSSILHPAEQLTSMIKNASGDLEVKIPLGKGLFRLGQRKGK